ncbi:MAG: ribosome small subunit-dependent GTPase A [Candidatus Dojkabacteria bacterium]|nr:MAG: ribosome small subunit-dependent GTPase A [Candidatus Dojkabacteria bacterium]
MDYEDSYVSRRDKKRDRKIRNNSLGKNLNLTGVISNDKIDSMWESVRPSATEAIEGVVVESRNDFVTVMVGDKPVQAKYDHSLPAVLRQSLIVGDEVMLSDSSSEPNVAYRKRRRSFIARKKIDSTRKNTEAKEIQVWAANIDIAVIVVAAANPAFHPNMVDRYLLMAEFGGVKPIICYNKVDLVEVISPDLPYYSDKLGVEIVHTSAEKGLGIDELKGVLKGSRSIFVGPSGVGKSSLVNALRGSTDLKTQEVGNKTLRGRHTTTDTKMYKFDKDSWVIDSPGIRSLDVSFISREDARFYFEDLLVLAVGCAYSDCLHLDEPDCAVRAAVRAGELDERRYESYARLVE